MQHDHGRHRLAPLGVGDADHRRLGDRGVRHEHFFDLARRDVLRAPHDDVVQPPVDVEEAVHVEPAGVPGAEPAVLGERALPDVLAGHLLAAHPDLALLARREGRLVDVAHLHLEGREGSPDRTQPRPDGRVVAGEGLAVLVGGEHGDGGTGFRQPVRVDQVDVGHVRQGPLDELERHAPAAVGEVAQGRQLDAALFERGEDPAQHGRHHHGVGDALVRRQLHPGGGLEGRQVHDATPRVQRAQHRRDAGDVVRGHADQLRLRRLAAEELDARDDVGDEMPVAQDRRLGLRRGAAREEQHGDLLGVDEGVLAGDRLGDGRGELRLGDDVSRTDGVEALDLFVVGDHDPAGDTAEDAAQLLVGGAVVDRRERDARQRRTEERHRQRVRVQPEVPDDFGAGLLEVDGGPPGALEELGGGDATVVGAEDDALGVTLGRHFEQHGDVHDGVPFPLSSRTVSPRRAAAWRP